MKKINVEKDMPSDQLFEEFKTLHFEKIDKWMTKHPGETPPIYYDNKTNVIRWMSRKELRDRKRRLL